MPRWTGQTDPVAAAYWAGTDVPPEPGRPTGPEINHVTQLLDAVALGRAVAYGPASTASQYRRTDLVFVPVSDLSTSQVVAAWPDTSRSSAVAAFVRAAIDTAACAAPHRPERSVATGG